MLPRGLSLLALAFAAFACAWLLNPEPDVSIPSWAASFVVAGIGAIFAAYLRELIEAGDASAGVAFLKAMGAFIALAAAFVVWEGSVDRSPSLAEFALSSVMLTLGIGTGLVLTSEGGSKATKNLIDWFLRR